MPSPGALARPPRPFALALALVATAAAAALAACDAGPAPEKTKAAPARTVDPQKPWSRLDFGARGADVGDAGPATTATVDPLALDDFLHAVPSSAPAATDPDAGTLVGKDTGLPDGGPQVTVEEPAARDKGGVIQLGVVAVQADMASPALEREARAQIYFPLVTRCRAKDGAILPADAVLLEFTIDIDGYIVPQNITATATNPDHEAAAACMRRELSGISFRGPPGARGHTAQVKMTVPSVD